MSIVNRNVVVPRGNAPVSIFNRNMFVLRGTAPLSRSVNQFMGLILVNF